MTRAQSEERRSDFARLSDQGDRGKWEKEENGREAGPSWEACLVPRQEGKHLVFAGARAPRAGTREKIHRSR